MLRAPEQLAPSSQWAPSTQQETVTPTEWHCPLETSFNLDLIAGRRESLPIGRLSMLAAEAAVYGTASAAPPLTRDPTPDPFVVPKGRW